MPLSGGYHPSSLEPGSHRAANGQTVGIHEDFIVGGAALAFPGDPAGPPEEVINCRCVSVPVEDEEDLGDDA